MTRPTRSRRSPPASRDGDHVGSLDPSHLSAAFWATHIKIGCALFCLESAATIVYLLVTPRRRAAPTSWVDAMACVLLAAVATVMAFHVASHLQKAFSTMWTLVASVLLAVGICLDGGIKSPLVVLLWLPVVYAGLALEPVPTAIMGGVGCCELIAAAAVAGANAPTGLTVIASAAMAGAVALAVATSANRTRLQESERSLAEWLTVLATIDGLTGCLNWRTFGERLDVEIARSVRYDQPLTLLMIDIDDFKAINDRWGHLGGDAVLARFGEELLAECRKPDVVGRVGGDEFAAVLPQTSAAGARSVAERLLGRTFDLEAPPLTLSIGVAQLDHVNSSADRLMSNADHTLYEVKSNGGNGFAVSDGCDPALRTCPLLAIAGDGHGSRGVLTLYRPLATNLLVTDLLPTKLFPPNLLLGPLAAAPTPPLRRP